ncbi:hypothetical protein VSS74_14685 [Conexibacter stalactiti]|uniref:Uncharacterized protein n=1 Tax=Conexibacter stalactiti TaxID=1940611 RepID=A0ABU4HQK1_9ACTN|nr:hypothetical protein [Conexibacter stalactiti]MDW5595593.1 hypothetical protein [Conexibacter stalactiti]MEC5036235.1 hypothetical protein [Conexibacter stalactiti]
MSARRIALAAALLALSLLATASTAAPAAVPKQARWLATFEMTQEVAWRMPRFVSRSDCYHRFWSEGSGDERWQIKTRRPVKVLAYHLSKNNPVVFKYGSWDMADMTTNGLDAAGMRVRRMHVAMGSYPGRCGGGDVTDPPRETDCGSRIPSYDVTFGFGRRKAFFSVHEKDEQPIPFVTCMVQGPPDFGLDEPAPAGASFSAAALLAGTRTVEIKGALRDRDEIRWQPGNGRTTSTGSIRWKLTLTPAGRGR